VLPYKLKRNLKENESLKNWTTIRTGGIAKFMFFPEDIEEILDIIHIAKRDGIKFYFLGNGSKVLFPDNNFDGIIINMRNFANLKMDGEMIEVSSGYSLQKLLKIAQDNGLTGMEGLIGIPATIGGALKMNAGSYGYEMGKVVEEVTILRNENVLNEKYKFIYRRGLNEGIYLKAKIKLEKSEKLEIEKRMNEFFSIKTKTQPINMPTFGSVFKNPEGFKAWELIKGANCDKIRIGDAAVSEIHSNFIVNLGNARTEEILEIIKIIKDKVYEKYNVMLEEEVNIVS